MGNVSAPDLPTLRQLPLEEWRDDGTQIALCTLPMEPHLLSERTNLEFSRALDQFGEVYLALATLDGDTVLFEAHPKGAGPPETEFVTVFARGDVRDLANLLERLLLLVRISPDDLLWQQPDFSPREWALFRLDDNGNRFVMSYFRDRSLAEKMALAYEHRGHKQTYYVDRAP